MKKALVLLLGVIMLLTMAACGNAPAETKAEEPTPAAEENAPADETTETAFDPYYFSQLKEGASNESPAANPAKERYTIGVLLPMLSNAHFTTASESDYGNIT